MDILKYRNELVGKPGLVYCGRPKTDTWYRGQLLIGLGNPFSWKPTKLAKFKVKNLEESLSGYRHWLFKLLSAHKKQCLEDLEPWEIDYLHKTLELARTVKSNEVQGALVAPKARGEKRFTRQAPAPNTELIDKEMDEGRNSRRRCTQCMVKKNGLINENKTAIKNATNILSSAVTKVSKSVSINYIEAVSLVTAKPKTSKNRKIGSNAASTHSTE